MVHLSYLPSGLNQLIILPGQNIIGVHEQVNLIPKSLILKLQLTRRERSLMSQSGGRPRRHRRRLLTRTPYTLLLLHFHLDVHKLCLVHPQMIILHL
jgi:hypothetical protein